MTEEARVRFIELITAICFIAFGGIFVWYGITEYKFWLGKGPGSGFFPTVSGLLLIGATLVVLFKKQSGKPLPFDMRSVIPVVIVGVGIMVVPVIGLLPMLAVMTFFWIKVIEKGPMFQALLSTFLVALVVWLIFRFWLDIVFPDNLLSDFLTNIMASED